MNLPHFLYANRAAGMFAIGHFEVWYRHWSVTWYPPHVVSFGPFTWRLGASYWRDL